MSCRDGDGGYQATIPNTTTIASLANKGTNFDHLLNVCCFVSLLGQA